MLEKINHCLIALNTSGAIKKKKKKDSLTFGLTEKKRKLIRRKIPFYEFLLQR